MDKLNFAEKMTGMELTAEEFNRIPSKIDEIIDAVNGSDHGDKVGHMEYEGGKIVYYDKEGGRRLGSISLTGTVYAITLQSITPQLFYVLSSETSHYLSVTPSTQSGTLGAAMSDFIEDYIYSVAIDSGSGTFREVETGICRSGNIIHSDIRSHVTTGSNRIRISVTGTESGQVKTAIWTCNLTSLTLTSNFSWWRPWIEGQTYAIDGLTLGGNLQKTLYVRIDDDDNQTYTQTFSASTSYTTSAYSFSLADRFPASGTGVHTVELWLAGDGVETKHYIYRVMCVAEKDRNTAQLVCFNHVSTAAVNFDTQQLLEYATYNAVQVTLSVTVQTQSGQTFVVADRLQQTVQTQSPQGYSTALELDTDEQTGLVLTVSAIVGSGETEYIEQQSMPVDNSNSYAATEGATFYMNAAQRTNGSADREEFLNIAPGAQQTSFAGTWNGFAWSVDGWYADSDGRRCLKVAAGSEIIVPDLKPLASAGTDSLSIEMKVRMSTIADYESPILSFMSTDEYDDDVSCGIILFPTRLLVLTSTEREIIPQSVNLSEDKVLHLVIVLQRGYGTTGRNLCHIYVNGIRNSVFEYAGNAGFGNGCLRIGQASSDLYLYMLRTYAGRALEYRDVLTNWLNTITDGSDFTRSGVRADNNIVDGGQISYDLCKAAGYNCMIVETENDVPVPSLEYTTGCLSTLSVEYNDHPEWSFSVKNAPIGGQGTTSMRYYRWNFRWKMTKDCIWTYADGTTETGKGGWIAGYGLHPKCEKITAKKNYASSSQGHKMGATAMYDELYEQLGLKASLPDMLDRVAVYQYPMIGFQKHADGSYDFIGLYTFGPDKGDKNSFGYDTKAYPKLLSLEGPNHAPLGTRFLHPWNEDVDYDPSQETLCFGGEEGWDVDVCAYETDEASDKENVLQLLTDEWKPAYDIVYYCSPYLRSLTELGITLAELNSDPDSFRNRMDVLGNRKNEVLQLYDNNYQLIYFRTKTGQYEVLSGHSILNYLSDYLTTETPTTAEIIETRMDKFRTEASNFWSIDDATFHDCYCELTGSSDNHAKNSYPFKFKPLSEGGRWSWREDDLDTLLATDNNGQSTKSYSIEVGDVTADGTDIFQGSSSAFWTLIEECFWPAKATMMKRIVDALVSMAAERNVAGAYVHESVFNMFAHYFWNNWARYFPATSYNEDAAWAYIRPWSIDAGKSYNGVYPLSQALGDQYEAEQLWVYRRIAYVMSMYSLGGFTGSGDDGYGRIEFTPAETFTFQLKPAIDLYPAGNRGGGSNVKGARTKAGEECLITATSDGSTTFYLKGVDWLTSLGDLCGLKLTNRGGDASVGAAFSVSGKRLRELKIGDADAEQVKFNAGALSVNGQALEVIDAQNVTSLSGNVSLLSCPRLKRALFAGTNIPTLFIPRGARITEISFPDGLQTLFLHTLPILTEEGMTIPDKALKTITGIYYNECPGISPFSILRKIFNTEGNALQFLTLIWTTPVSGNDSDLEMLATFAGKEYDAETGKGYGAVTFNSEQNLLSNSAAHPDLEGTININANVYEDSVLTLRNYFGAALVLNITGKLYIRFADSQVGTLCISNWGDGVGITREQLATVSSIGTVFKGKAFTSFEEFRFFTGIQSIPNDAFNNCTAMQSILLPESVTILSMAAFAYCSALEGIILPNVVSIGSYCFRDCRSLRTITLSEGITSIGLMTFYNCQNLQEISLPEGVTTIGNEAFRYCSSLEHVILPDSLENIGQYAFQNCPALTQLTIPEHVTSLGNNIVFNMNITLTILAPTPPTVDRSLSNTVTAIYVPVDSVEAYKAADVWKTFAGKIYPIPED